MKKILATTSALTLALGLLAAQSATAGTVSWTDWSTAGTNQVTGTLTLGVTTIGVTYSGTYNFAQTNGVGTNYWVPPTPYISGTVSNAPGNSDIITLNDAGPATITFSQPVTNPVIALVSWNGAVVTFGESILTLSSGCGFWGCGSFTNVTANGFDGSGELHGVVEVPGTFTSITFNDTVSENWHGFTVGAAGLAVPEPATLSLLGAGLLGLGLIRRRRA
jgi:PEP-CTERM motif